MTAALVRAADTTIEFLRSLPGIDRLIQRATDEQATAALAERRQLASEITRIEAAQLAAVRQHARTIGPAKARIAELEQQLTAARAGLVAVESDWLFRNQGTARQLDRLRGRLVATAPREAVETFEDQMRAELDGLRLQADHIETRGIDGKLYERWSNRHSLIRRGAALSAAIGAARALETAVLDPPALQAELDALRDGLPCLDERPADAHLL